jgi:hypothetical protein
LLNLGIRGTLAASRDSSSLQQICRCASVDVKVASQFLEGGTRFVGLPQAVSLGAIEAVLDLL